MPDFQVHAAAPAMPWRLRRLSTAERAVQAHPAPDSKAAALTNDRAPAMNGGAPLLAVSAAEPALAATKPRRGSMVDIAKAAMQDLMDSLKRPSEAERYLLEVKLQQLATAIREEKARLEHGGDGDREAMQVLITQFESVESQLARWPTHGAQAVPFIHRARG